MTNCCACKTAFYTGLFALLCALITLKVGHAADQLLGGGIFKYAIEILTFQYKEGGYAIGIAAVFWICVLASIISCFCACFGPDDSESEDEYQYTAPATQPPTNYQMQPSAYYGQPSTPGYQQPSPYQPAMPQQMA